MKSLKLFLFITFLTAALFVSAKSQVTKLVCEYHENPIGTGVENPRRLSWKILSDEEEVKQIAYEIRVADSPSNLNRKSRLIWNSGKVESGQSVNVVYKGPALNSMQRVYWKVRVWDNKGNTTQWSEPAFWEMGMLEPAMWKASWITMKNEPKVKESLPVHYYRSEFTADKKIESARVYVSSLGLYQLFINGEKVSDDLFTPGWTSYENRVQYQTYDVTPMIRKNNAIGAMVGDGWYRGNIGFRGQRAYFGDQLGLIVQLVINYSDGTNSTITTDKNWKTATGPVLYSDIYDGEMYDANMEMEGWAVAGFDEDNWENAAILNHPKDILVAPQGVPVKAVEEIKPIDQIITPRGEMVVDMGQNMVGWVRIRLNGEKGDTVVMKFAEVLDKEGNFYTENLRDAKCTDTYILKGEGEEIYEPHFTFHGFRYLKLEGLYNRCGDIFRHATYRVFYLLK